MPTMHAVTLLAKSVYKAIKHQSNCDVEITEVQTVLEKNMVQQKKHLYPDCDVGVITNCLYLSKKEKYETII